MKWFHLVYTCIALWFLKDVCTQTSHLYVHAVSLCYQHWPGCCSLVSETWLGSCHLDRKLCQPCHASTVYPWNAVWEWEVKLMIDNVFHIVKDYNM